MRASAKPSQTSNSCHFTEGRMAYPQLRKYFSNYPVAVSELSYFCLRLQEKDGKARPFGHEDAIVLHIIY